MRADAAPVAPSHRVTCLDRQLGGQEGQQFDALLAWANRDLVGGRAVGGRWRRSAVLSLELLDRAHVRRELLGGHLVDARLVHGQIGTGLLDDDASPHVVGVNRAEVLIGARGGELQHEGRRGRIQRDAGVDVAGAVVGRSAGREENRRVEHQLRIGRRRGRRGGHRCRALGGNEDRLHLTAGEERDGVEAHHLEEDAVTGIDRDLAREEGIDLRQLLHDHGAGEDLPDPGAIWLLAKLRGSNGRRPTLWGSFLQPRVVAAVTLRGGRGSLGGTQQGHGGSRESELAGQPEDIPAAHPSGMVSRHCPLQRCHPHVEFHS